MALNNNPTANEVVKAIKDLEKPATTGNIGLVKPDGISITIDNDGTIRSQSSGNVTSITAGTGLSGGTITTSGTIALSSETQASLLKADSAVQPGDLGTLASQNSIDYTSNQITNKPTIPTTTNELTNNSGFITNAVNNLTNYYKKTETYTQTEIDSLIANIKTITAEIVTSLPTASSTTYFNTSKKIYLVLSNNDSDDFYNEYITILKDSEYFWEKIGDTKIDLTDYVKNTDYANTSKGGVVIVNNDDGVGIRENGVLQVVPATTAEIDAKTQERKPIVPNTLDYAIEKGLGANSLIWTDTEKLNARNTIGAGTSNFSGDYNDLTNKLTSVNGLSGGTISSAITVNGNVNGKYLIGTWLQATHASDNANWTDVWVNSDGWLYKRAKASFKSDLEIPDTSTLMTKENPTGTGTFNFTGNQVLTGNLQAAGLTDGTTTKTMTDILASGKLYTTTGQNTDGPMSQKATTDELAKKMGNFSLSIGSTNGGNPRPTLFVTVDYNNFTSNSGAYFKLSATGCHGNGASYAFLEDVIIGVSYSGTISCNVYKYAQTSCGVYQGADRHYGDVFYVHDSTAKTVKFYILLGQYSSAQFTPATKIGLSRAISAANGITQHTGTPTYYSSGDIVWAIGNNTTYARLNDIPYVSQSTGTDTAKVMSQKATTDELTAIITTLSNKFTNHPQSAYDCNTCYDEGVYLVANGSNCPSGIQYGSLFVMPYRKPTGNTKPDYCVQIYLPNGDDSTHPNSMFYRTSLADSWNNWKEVASISDVQAKIDNLQTQINNMLNGTTTFTYLKAKIVDLV